MIAPEVETGDGTGIAWTEEVDSVVVYGCALGPIHIVFSSSVLALGSGGERGYETGWECLIEATIAEMTAHHGRIPMSVLYPVRLVESRSLRRPASLLHSTYAHLARVMNELGNP